MHGIAEDYERRLFFLETVQKAVLTQQREKIVHTTVQIAHHDGRLVCGQLDHRTGPAVAGLGSVGLVLHQPIDVA